MIAVKINFNERSFLLPESHSDYEMEYITDHKSMIESYIRASDILLNDLSEGKDISESHHRVLFIKNELADFKEVTGIIGTPFDSRDVALYIIENNIEIILEMDI